VVNVAQVRSLLKLPADASPLSATDAVHRRYADLLAVAVPQLESPYTASARVMAAINFSQVTAAANSGIGTDQVVVLATTQPFAQLAGKLTAAGYTRSGDLLRMPAQLAPGEIPAIAGTQGFVALGTDPATVQAVAEGHAKGVNGPVRDALTTLNSPVAESAPLAGSCLTGFAMSDDITGDAGRFLITTNNPQANRLTMGNVTSLLHVQLGTATASGDQLTVPYTYKPSAGAPPLDSLGELPINQIYRCP
jgi:hypothetical protein